MAIDQGTDGRPVGAIFATDTPAPDAYRFADDGRTPNSRYPVLLYKGAPTTDLGLADAIERVFESHEWPPQWRGGIFDFHHYHSTAHEALGVARGSATLVIGGEAGQSLRVGAGDVLVLPAGTGHCRLAASNDFLVVGAYPRNASDWDLCRSDDPEAYVAACARISAVAVPTNDPVRGLEASAPISWS